MEQKQFVPAKTDKERILLVAGKLNNIANYLNNIGILSKSNKDKLAEEILADSTLLYDVVQRIKDK